MWLALALLLPGLNPWSTPATPAAPEWVRPQASPHAAPEGTVQLVWRLPAEHLPTGTRPRFQLRQQSRRADGEGILTQTLLRFTGPDLGTYVTGLAEGNYIFQVRQVPDEGEPGPWSSELQVKVAYVDGRVVGLLMGVGTVVLVLTIGAVVLGHRREAMAPRPLA